MPAWLAPAIGGAASLIGSGINSLFSGNQARKTRAANMRLAEYQYSQDKEMWNTANEYNTPKKQMERLKEGGLNPNLVYGNGSVVGNTSTQTPSQSVPDMSARGKLDLNPNVLGVLNQFQDYENKKVQNDNLTQQTKMMQQQQELNEIKMWTDKEKGFLTMSQRSDLDNTIGLKIKALEAKVKKEQASANIFQKDWQNYQQTGLPTSAPWYTKMAQDLFRKYIQKQYGK